MSGIEQIPGQCRLKAYDSTNATWLSVAVQTSGEVKIANGETLISQGVIMATQASGGVEIGSGVVERVVLSVPTQQVASGAIYGNSGDGIYGVWVGGKSGNNPCSASGNFSGAYGLWVAAGHQKEIFVQNLNEVYVCGEPSGWPVTYVGEVIA